MALLLPWIVYKSHSLMLESAIQREDLHMDRIKDEVQNGTTRLITLLKNKSDPMFYTLERDRDIDLLLQLLTAILSREKSILFVSIIDTKGRLIAGLGRDPINGRFKKILPPEELSKYEFRPESPTVVIPSMGRNYIGSPRMHEGKLSFDIAVPVGKRESPAGVLLASVNVEELWSETGLKLARPGVTSYILDRRGSILSTPPPRSGYKQGDILTWLYIVRALIVSEKYIHPEPYEGLMGIPVFGIGVQIEILNWAVISEIPERMITTPIYRFLLAIIVLGVLLAALFGWLGFRLVNGMLAPIVSVSKSFKKAQAGDYSESDTTSYITETNQLVHGFNQMIRDILQREMELVKHREHLEKLVEERTGELAAVNKELEAFAYSVSHDLRAPLRGIDGFSQALLEDYEDKLDDEGKDYLYELSSSANQMSQLIDSLLVLSRITRKEIKHEQINLRELALTVVEGLKKTNPERKVVFDIEDKLCANGDLNLMRILMHNLLENA